MPLRRKLILLLCGLTAVVLVLAGAVAYQEVRQASRLTVEQLLIRTVDQLTGLAATTTVARDRLKREVGADPALRALLRGEPTDSAAVAEALGRLRTPADSGLAVQVWDTAGARIFTDRVQPGSLPPPAAPLDTAPSYGSFLPRGEEVHYWSTAPVRAEDGAVLGWVVQERRIGNPERAEQIEQLVGSDSRIVFAVPGDSVAVSLAGAPVPAIPTNLATDSTFSYEREGAEFLARAGAVPATPWRVLVEVPHEIMEARPAAFLENMVLLGLVLLVLTVAVAWLLGRGITAPVDELVSAAESMARGDFTGTVPVRADGDGDELDRLARAFNTMARRVESSHAELRLRLAEERKLARNLEQSKARAEAARRQAEAANRAKTEFLATVSHEIRTPINAVVGYCDLLDMEIGGPLTDDQREQVERIRRSSRVLKSLVEDLLDFSHLGSGRLQMNVGVGSLKEAAVAAAATLQPQAMKKGLTIDVEVSEGLQFVGDAGRVQQILMNLLSNSVKFTEKGGIRLRAGAVSGDDGPQLPGSDGFRPRVRIEVEDTGPGIPKEQREDVFAPFVQGDMSLTRRHGGTGLGLSICRKLARMMGGEVTAGSAPGGGARFTLWLLAPTVASVRAAGDGGSPPAVGTSGSAAVGGDAEPRPMGDAREPGSAGRDGESVAAGDDGMERRI